jgi:hypothetical protein
MTRLLLLLTLLPLLSCASTDYEQPKKSTAELDRDRSICLDSVTKRANQLGLATDATWINEELAQCLEKRQGRTPRQPAP